MIASVVLEDPDRLLIDIETDLTRGDLHGSLQRYPVTSADALSDREFDLASSRPSIPYGDEVDTSRQQFGFWVRVMPDTTWPSISASMGSCQCSAMSLPPGVCPEAS